MYDLIVEYDNGENIVIPEVSTDEAMDFMEEYSDANGFSLVRVV